MLFLQKKVAIFDKIAVAAQTAWKGGRTALAAGRSGC